MSEKRYNAILQGDRNLISFLYGFLRSEPDFEVNKKESELALRVKADDVVQASLKVEHTFAHYARLYNKMYGHKKVEFKTGFNEKRLINFCYEF